MAREEVARKATSVLIVSSKGHSGIGWSSKWKRTAMRAPRKPRLSPHHNISGTHALSLDGARGRSRVAVDSSALPKPVTPLSTDARPLSVAILFRLTYSRSEIRPRWLRGSASRPNILESSIFAPEDRHATSAGLCFSKSKPCEVPPISLSIKLVSCKCIFHT